MCGLLGQKASYFWNLERAVQYSSHWPHVTVEHLKCGFSGLRFALSVKCILDFEHFVQKKEYKTSDNIFYIDYLWQ